MHYTCNCCGKVYRGNHPQDSNRDTGFGECPECVTMKTRQNEADWRRLEEKVRVALSPKNAAHFLSLETGVKRGMILQMMDDGIITHHVVRRSI